MWIGRYRAQGEFALFGPGIPWGDVESVGLEGMQMVSRVRGKRKVVEGRDSLEEMGGGGIEEEEKGKTRYARSGSRSLSRNGHGNGNGNGKRDGKSEYSGSRVEGGRGRVQYRALGSRLGYGGRRTSLRSSEEKQNGDTVVSVSSSEAYPPDIQMGSVGGTGGEGGGQGAEANGEELPGDDWEDLEEYDDTSGSSTNKNQNLGRGRGRAGSIRRVAESGKEWFLKYGESPRLRKKRSLGNLRRR